jgi:hypothetical protein
MKETSINLLKLRYAPSIFGNHAGRQNVFQLIMALFCSDVDCISFYKFIQLGSVPINYASIGILICLKI